MKITIYGAGYVGLVTAACFAEIGHEVLCVEIDKTKVARLLQGQIDIYEPFLPELVLRHLGTGRLNFTDDLAKGVEFSLCQFICVGTPSNEDGSADVQAVFKCAEAIAHLMNNPRIIVTKSTVPVGTGLQISERAAAILQQRGLTLDCAVVSNPEFLQEGHAVKNFQKPDRIVIGSNSQQARESVKSLYALLPEANHACIVMMSLNEAEFTKYAANAMLAARISFMNEMANLADRTHVDIKQVEYAIGLDPRIGPHFLLAGCGYGGSCFPKDVRALRHLAKQNGYEPLILDAIEKTNEQQKSILFEKVAKYFKRNLSGKIFALWGLSFKPQTNDMREASSRVVLESLLAAGATIKAYDPVAMPDAKEIYDGIDRLIFCDSATECLIAADALIIITEWPEFISADLSLIKSTLKQPLIFDGRNIFDLKAVAQAGIEYFGVGRRTN